jgi:hypothetical protein
MLEIPPQNVQSAWSTVAPVQQRSAGVIAFPARQSQGTTFRERVIQDLIKTRVMIAD